MVSLPQLTVLTGRCRSLPQVVTASNRREPAAPTCRCATSELSMNGTSPPPPRACPPGSPNSLAASKTYLGTKQGDNTQPRTPTARRVECTHSGVSADVGAGSGRCGPSPAPNPLGGGSGADARVQRSGRQRRRQTTPQCQRPQPSGWPTCTTGPGRDRWARSKPVTGVGRVGALSVAIV